MTRRGWSIWLVLLPVILPAQEHSLSMDTIRLDEYTITRSIPLNDQNVLDLSRSSGFSSIDRINARLEGVSLIRRGAYALEPQMDGFCAGQINVTVDGMKMFGACTDRMDPVTSYVETINLQEFNITHGTNGIRNGSTVGGSFDMILREPGNMETDGFYFESGLGYESASKGLNANGAFELQKEKWALRTSASFRNHKSYTGGDGSRVPYSYFTKINLHSAVKYKLSTSDAIRFDFLLDDAVNVGYPALPMDVGLARARMYALEFKRENAHRTVSLLRAKAYYNSVYHLMDDSKRDSTFILKGISGKGDTGQGDTVYMRMDMPGWSDTYGFYLEGSVRTGEKSSLFLKVDNYLNRTRAHMFMFMNYPRFPGEPPMYSETWPDTYRNVTGIYASHVYRATPRLKLILNGRIDYSATRVTSETGYDQFAIFGFNIDQPYDEFPKNLNLSVDYSSGKFLDLEAGAGYAERLPTISEQFGFYLYNALDGYDYLGNPEIGMESSRHLWGNLHFTWPGFKVSLRNRLNYIKDYIIGKFEPDLPGLNLYASGLKSYQNIPHALLMGSSMELQWKPTEYLMFYSLSSVTSGRTNLNNPLPLIPPFRNLFLTKFKKNFFSIQLESESAMAQDRIHPDFGEHPTPGYMIYHVRTTLNWKLRQVGMETSMGVENIFNKAYSEHLDWGSYLRPGRNVYLSLRIII